MRCRSDGNNKESKKETKLREEDNEKNIRTKKVCKEYHRLMNM